MDFCSAVLFNLVLLNFVYRDEFFYDIFISPGQVGIGHHHTQSYTHPYKINFIHPKGGLEYN